MKPIFLICLCLTMTAASSRLRLFMRHHSRRTKFTNRTRAIKAKLISNSRLAVYDVRLRQFTGQTKVTTETPFSQSTFAMLEVSQITGETRVEQSKLKSMNRICTFKTCSKCAKYVTSTSNIAFKHCTVILNMPQCCPTEHILLNGF